MQSHRYAALLAYGIAVLTPGLALLFTWLLAPLWTQTQFSIFFAAVVISAWWGGLRPGLVALVVSALLVNLFVLPPRNAFVFDNASVIQLGVFALVACFITSLQCRRRWAEQALAVRTRQQAALAELSQAALAGLDLDALFATTVTRVAETLGVECCQLWELRPDGRALCLRAGMGWTPGPVGQASIEVGPHSQAGYTLRQEAPVIVTDLHTERRFEAPPWLRDHGVVSGMSVIIQGRDAPFGVLDVHTTRRRTFTSEDVHFLQAVAGMLAQAIARKGAEAALQKADETLAARQQREAQQQRALRETELLLKEVHHRVKNHLQMIASLLDLQAEMLEDARVRAILEESQQRIHTIALLHEHLYQGGDLARVYAPEYLTRLCTHLHQAYGAPTDRLALDVEVDPVWLEVRTAIPCGLILQELLTNAFTHGFPRGEAGTITVALNVTPAGEALLTVHDTGVGVPEGLDVHPTESLGLQLVRLLTEQLGGTIRLERGMGTQWTLTFPVPSAQGHEDGETQRTKADR